MPSSSEGTFGACTELDRLVWTAAEEACRPHELPADAVDYGADRAESLQG